VHTSYSARRHTSAGRASPRRTLRVRPGQRSRSTARATASAGRSTGSPCPTRGVHRRDVTRRRLPASKVATTPMHRGVRNLKSVDEQRAVGSSSTSSATTAAQNPTTRPSTHARRRRRARGRTSRSRPSRDNYHPGTFTTLAATSDRPRPNAAEICTATSSSPTSTSRDIALHDLDSTTRRSSGPGMARAGGERLGVLAFPHNSNGSKGMMLSRSTTRQAPHARVGEEPSPLRALIEMYNADQGNSEVYGKLWPADGVSRTSRPPTAWGASAGAPSRKRTSSAGR